MNPLMQMPPPPGATGQPDPNMPQGGGADLNALIAALLAGDPGSTGGPPQPGAMPPGVIPPGMAPPPGMDSGAMGMMGMAPGGPPGGPMAAGQQPDMDLIQQMLMAAGQQPGGGPMSAY